MSDTFAFIRNLTEIVETPLPSGLYQVTLRVATTATKRSDVYPEVESLNSLFGVIAVVVEYSPGFPPLVRVTGKLGNVTAFLAKYYGLE